MTLPAIWFFLWVLLWAIYFVTDGFDLGIGMLLPFVSKDETETRTMYNSVGPLWDGNEAWLITAGGVTFAAFPKMYAVMFSSLYTALFLLLVALIIRGISFEFRSKSDNKLFKKLCDVSQFFGSALIALLFGVAFANIFRGLPIENGINQAGLLGLLNPYGILGGVFFMSLFLVHGAIWLAAKTSGHLNTKALKAANALWYLELIVAVGFLVYTWFETALYKNYLNHPPLFIVLAVVVLALISVKVLLLKKRLFPAFFASAITILGTVFFAFIGLFPNMLPSTIDPENNSIIYSQAASSPLTLKVMLVVVLIFLPFVIGYQIWAYKLFKDHVDTNELIY